jgi:translation initiation factor 1
MTTEETPVYSTDPGFCPACRRSPCLCADPKAVKKRQPEALRLSFSRGAKGSGVTRVERLIMHPTLKERLLSRFKKRLGCGGAIKGGDLELQGDQRDFLEAELKAEGYSVKRVGG